MIKIVSTDPAKTIELPADLYWADELGYTPVKSVQEYTTTGAQIIDVSKALAGRPITLQAEDDSFSWVKRSVLLDLQTLAAIPGLEMVLTVNDTDYDVVFAPGTEPFSAEPIWHYSSMEADDFYYLSALRFLTI